MNQSEMKLPSQHQIDDVVVLKFAVTGVKFTENKVFYDLQPEEGSGQFVQFEILSDFVYPLPGPLTYLGSPKPLS